MHLTAVDIAVLPPDPLKSLAIRLSEKISPDFHLNGTDVLPHITLGIGFVEEMSDVVNQVSKIVSKIRPFEVVVEKAVGRYLMCKKSEQLYRLHKKVCDTVKFVKVGHLEKVGDEAYFGREILDSTKEFTANYKWRNAYLNFIPHVTVAWDDKVKVDTSEVRQLPLKFMVKEIFICQLGNHNTCRKILGKFNLGEL